MARDCENRQKRAAPKEKRHKIEGIIHDLLLIAFPAGLDFGAAEASPLSVGDFFCNRMVRAHDVVVPLTEHPKAELRREKLGDQMGSVQSFLSEHAGVFVMVAWALFLAVIIADYFIGLPIAISDSYGDAQTVWPVHATIVWWLVVATVLALGVAVGASIAVATSHHALASIAVFGVWAVLAVGGAISMALTPAGPQELFTRFVGVQRYSLPRRYKVANEESGRLTFIVCLNPFDEQDRQLCQQHAYVSVRSPSEGLDDFADVKFWQTNRFKMRKLEPMFDHDQFVFTWPLDYDPSKTASNFYLVRYDGDRLTRLVKCYSKSAKSKCTQYTFSGGYLLMIDSEMWALEHWLEVERDVAALIASWRTPEGH